MAITRAKKEELVSEYIDLLEQSSAVVFVRSRGLSVAQVTALRSKMRETGSKYRVVKNTLFRRALTGAKMSVPDIFGGPVTVAFCPEDIAPAVKAINDFTADLGDVEFGIVGGIVGDDVLDAMRTKALASLPTKDVLFAQILAGMNAPATQLAGVVAAGIRQILNVLQARVDQLEESGSAA